MIQICSICALMLVALGANAYFKFKSYNKSDKTLWEDGDSVRIKGPQGEVHNDGFMTRIG